MNSTSSQPTAVLVSDASEGGAAVAARRLAEGMQATGLSVRHWHFSPQGNGADFQRSLDPNRKRPLFERLMKNFSRPLAERMRRRRHERALLAHIAGERPTWLNLHNLHASGLDHASLHKIIPQDIPLVWTMHDCWSFASFAYCWIDANGNTAVQGNRSREPDANQSRRNFFEVRRDVLLVSPSRWLAQEARRNVPPAIRVEVVPNGLPVGVFRPILRAEAKRLLGLGGEKLYLGFAAASVDSRKGGDVFLEAVRRMDRSTVETLIWGNDEHWQWPADLPLRRFGLVRDEGRMALLYSACDLFVCPSRIDNLPNTILESMACGTPVVGSAVGGIPELVRPGETGWLYRDNSPEACAKALADAMLERESWTGYSERCRRMVEAEFNLEKQARAYAALLKQLSGDR